MAGISNFTTLNVSNNPVVTVSSDGSTVTVGNQSTTEITYLLALINSASNVNETNIANAINQIQAANDASQQGSALLQGLSTVDLSSGSTTNAAIYTALHTSLASFNLSDTQIAALFKTATGATLGANDSTVMNAATFSSSQTNAKTYAQNLINNNQVLQTNLSNLTNNRTNFIEAMTALLSNLSTVQNTLVNHF